MAASYNRIRECGEWGQLTMVAYTLTKRRMNMIATQARRHQGFTVNKTFCVTLFLGVLVAKMENQMKLVRHNLVKVKK